MLPVLWVQVHQVQCVQAMVDKWAPQKMRNGNVCHPRRRPILMPVTSHSASCLVFLFSDGPSNFKGGNVFQHWVLFCYPRVLYNTDPPVPLRRCDSVWLLHCGKWEQDPVVPNQQCLDFDANVCCIPLMVFSSTAYVNTAKQGTLVTSIALRAWCSWTGCFNVSLSNKI